MKVQINTKTGETVPVLTKREKQQLHDAVGIVKALQVYDLTADAKIASEGLSGLISRIHEDNSFEVNVDDGDGASEE